MRVGWLVDETPTPGGAELTQAEFRHAAPEHVEIVDCPPGHVDSTCDRYVLHNCVQYQLADLEPIAWQRVVKYHHDVGPYVHPQVREWLTEHAVQVCCSPVQADFMGIAAHLIPPPIDLKRFEDAAAAANGRKGAVCIGSWGNMGKAPHRVVEWAAGNSSVDFYGSGPCAPAGSVHVAYDAIPSVLAKYRTFVYLPVVIEPFGRVVAEAWAAGCEIVTNNLVGAKYWVTDGREAGIENAADDFWTTVLA